MGRKTRWKLVAWIAGSVAIVFALMLGVADFYISRHARSFISEYLEGKFKSAVDLGNVRIDFIFPIVQMEAEDLALHFEGRGDLPPMIAVKHFTIRASLTGLLRNPRHIQYVHLDGLHITIPPRDERPAGENFDVGNTMKRLRAVRMDLIVSENAILSIQTAKPGKKPLEFDIGRLILNSTDTDMQLAFRATLTNPTPPGQIVSAGTFGPWNADTPSLTPVSGSYTFENADLGHFRGIGGILSSKGNYQGVLEKIEANGTTDTPDFRVTMARHPVDLSTKFQATVDGTNGDTYLHPVEAHFGKTTLIAQGSVEGVPGTKGKTITLDVTGEQARIEDLMLFAMKGSPSMSGPVRLKTKFILVPGPKEIPERLNLDGYFELDSVHFTNSEVQQKLDNMSKRSEGKPKEVESVNSGDTSDDVATSMKGNFHLREGLLTLSHIGFQIPGAVVHLDGTYDLPQENLDLHGKLEMQAKLSQVTTGVKSFLLRAVNPLFEKDGKGTVLPIKITGSAKHPSYGLDFHHKDTAKN